MAPIATPLIWLKYSLSKFRLLFSNINLALSKTNSLENLGYKDSGNSSSQANIESLLGDVHGEYLNIVPQRQMISHLFFLEHFARKSRFSLT